MLYSEIKKNIQSFISDKKFSEIIRGSTWAFFSRVITAGIATVTSIIIARIYGADTMGIVAMIESILIIATMFTLMGTNTSILKLIPEHVAKYSTTSAFKVYAKTRNVVIGISIIAGAGLFIFSNNIASVIFSKPNLSYYFALTSFFIVFKTLILYNISVVRALKKIKSFALLIILPHFVNLLMLIGLQFLYPIHNLPVYALLLSIGLTGIYSLLTIEYIFKLKMKSNEKVKVISARKILDFSLPMFMTATMVYIIGETGVILLGIFRTTVEVGYYTIAVKLSAGTTFMLSAVNSMAAPKFSELFNTEQIEELFRIAQKATRLIFWTTAPILVILILTGKFIISFLYGEEFTIAYWAMNILILGQFINSISGSTGYFMNMTGNEKIFRNIVVIAAIINLSLNFIFIPHFGIYGAALAGFISMAFWNVYILIYIKMKYGKTIGYIPVIVR